MDFAFLALAFIVGSLIWILLAALHGQYEGDDYMLCSKCGSVMDDEEREEKVCWRCSNATKA